MAEVITADVEGPPAWSKRHQIAFRVVSVPVVLLTLAYFVFGLLEVAIMWLPDRVLTDHFGGEEYPGGLLIHRSHFMAVGLVAWAVVPAVVVQLRRPWRRTAPMLQAAVIAVGGAIAYGLSGTLGEWVSQDLIITVPLLLLAALHPRVRDLFRRPGFDPLLLRLAAAAAVPWAVYGGLQARLQYRNDVGDLHAGIEHWAAALILAVAVVTCALVGASEHEGWRLSAWTAGLASLVFGGHSLVFPDQASGLPTLWAVAAIAWGLVFLTAVVRRSRGRVAV